MNVFDSPEFDNHEEVCFFNDELAGLRAITAIHSTRPLGRAGGGCRIYPYASADDALRDVLRLSRAMSYKLALFKIPSGGAKTVVIADPRTDKTEKLLRALGRFINTLGGRYTIAEDVGSTPEDMRIIARETPYVVHRGEDDRGGKAAEAAGTGYGVFAGIRASVDYALERESLAGVTVAVQGLGHVGWHVCKYLHEAGARLVVTDVSGQAVERVVTELGARAVAPDEIFAQEVDVFAPCALADVINDRTLEQLRCRIVCGGANNQLERPELAEALQRRGILYAPDFVANAGGVIAASFAALGIHDEERRRQALAGVGDVLRRVYATAAEEGLSTHRAAESLARQMML